MKKLIMLAMVLVSLFIIRANGITYQASSFYFEGDWVVITPVNNSFNNTIYVPIWSIQSIREREN